MPSRPMLTTPARSDHRPPRPASPIGTARPMAAARAPDDAMSSAPVTTRRIEIMASTPTAITAHSRRPYLRRLGLSTTVCVPTSSPAALMPGLLPWRAWQFAGQRAHGDPGLLEPLVGPPDQLVGDDDGEEDDALDDVDQLLGHARLDLQRVGLHVEEGPQQRREGDAHGVVAAEQRDGDAGETEPRLERRAVVEVLAEQQRHADQAGQGARGDHRGHHHARDLDAARDGGRLRAAGGAQVEPEPGLAEDEPVEEAHDDRQQDQRVDAVGGAGDQLEALELRGLGDRLGVDDVAALLAVRRP